MAKRGEKDIGGQQRCPACGDISRVKDSRPSAAGIRRRRACVTCGLRFTTYEITTSSGERISEPSVYLPDAVAQIFTARRALEEAERILSAIALLQERLRKV